MQHLTQPKRSALTWHRLLVIIFLLFVPPAVVGQPGQLTLVSVNSTGTGSGNSRSGDSGRYRITPDGRYVVFYSEAGDLVPLDAPVASDIFVRDLQTGQTKIASINLSGTHSTGGSNNGLISDNGRFVAFTSFANNLVNNDNNTSPDVFLRDFESGTTRLVSINAAGTASGALAGSFLIDMSPDGRFITFASGAQDLTAQADGNALGSDIYVRDVVNNVTRLVSINMAGTASGNGTSFGGSISADGRYVVFTSDASDLVANDTNTRDVFVRDLQTNTTKRVSTNAAGNAGGNGESSNGIIDKGGRFIVFGTRATDLLTLPDSNKLSDIFLYDVQNDSKKLLTVNTTGNATGGGFPPVFGFFDHGAEYSISADGRFVAFMSQLTNLVTNDTNGNGDDIFLYDIEKNQKSLVTVNLVGTSGSVGGSFKPAISADGRFVAFESLANDLVSNADETNGFTTDVFVRDMQKKETYLASLNNAGTRTGNGFSFQPVVSGDGRRVVFFSQATDLITNDLNGFKEDVFVFTLFTPGAPILLRRENSDRALALDSVTLLADPFPLVNLSNFSADQRTRISLFVSGLDLLPGEDNSAVTVQAENAQGAIFNLTIEHVGDQAGVSGTKQLVVKLPDGVVGDVWITVSLRGVPSNRALIKIKS